MGTKLEELRNGCFARAKDDEPMFVLLGRDPQAPSLVRQWATNRQREVELGKRPATDMEQVREAGDLANRMEAWREQADGSWRDGLFAVPEGDRHTNGATQPLDTSAEDMFRRQNPAS